MSINAEIADDDPLIPPSEDEESDRKEERTTLKTYRRRWYILVVYSLVAASQGLIWNTWGPLTQSAEQVFQWNDGTIALMTNWGPITYIFSTAFFTWLMDTKGLRISTILSSLLIAIGTGLRCIPGDNTVRTVLIHLGQLLNGIPGPLCMAAPPLISAVWFPVEQRTTATAIGTIAAGLGVTGAFVFGPLLVDDLSKSGNSTDHNKSFSLQYANVGDFDNFQNSSHAEIQKVRLQIDNYMYISFAYCAALLLAVVVYFPAKPPTPPSVTASIKRLDYISGLKSLFRNKKFWTFGIVYGVSIGVYNCFVTVIDVLLNKKNISQNDAAWLGCYCGLVGNVVALFVAYFADFFKRRMKLYIILFYTIASIAFIICSVSYSGWLIPFTKVTAYVILIAVAISLTAATPLFYELSCEASYPVAEGVTNGLLTWLNNFFGLIFLLILMFTPSDQDRSWMTWTMAAATVICIPFLLSLKARFGRLDVDRPNEHSNANINSDDSRQDTTNDSSARA